MATTDRAASLPRWIVFAAIAVVLLFMAAMVTQYVAARGQRAEVAALREQLTLARSEAMLGAAAAEAQQGRYEPARQLASRFFTGLQERITAAPTDERARLQPILSQRDQAITLLSRGDAASAPLLVRLVTEYRTALRGEATAP